MARYAAPPPPLDAASLDRMALRYVERFATTRAKLATYLRRKLRERGWAGTDPPDVEGLTERMATLGYVDDEAWATAKAEAMTRRGLGARRVRQALSHAGVEADDAAVVAPTLEATRIESALAFARRRRIGPYAPVAVTDRAAIERDMGRMVRAGHAPDLSRRIVRLAPLQANNMGQSPSDDEELIRSLS
jgi:regulatory protein